MFWMLFTLGCGGPPPVPPPTLEEAWIEVCAELESAQSAQAQGDHVGAEAAWETAASAFEEGVEPRLRAHDPTTTRQLEYQLGGLHKRLVKRGDPSVAVESWVADVELAIEALPPLPQPEAVP